MIKLKENLFPKSFWLLQQEAFLANSCILTGFEFMVKGGFDDKYKGHYYTSFFQISIGLERLLKLILISDHMLKNSYQPPNIKDIKNFGHDLISLYNKSKIISSESSYKFLLQELKDNSIRKNILIFMNSFAEATGRYHNISSISKASEVDPLDQWKNIINQIACEDFSESMMCRIETKVFERLNPKLQIQDIAEDTGYVNGVYRYVLESKANYYAVWNTLELIKPLIKLLVEISSKANNSNQTPGNYYPHIPYYDEIFLILYTDRKDALRRKQWTNLGI